MNWVAFIIFWVIVIAVINTLGGSAGKRRDADYRVMEYQVNQRGQLKSQIVDEKIRSGEITTIGEIMDIMYEELDA